MASIARTLTDEEAATLRAQYDAHEEARKTQYPGACSFTPEQIATLPTRPSNEDMSALEVYEWLRDKPETYSAYISDNPVGTGHVLTTWTGDRLGDAYVLSRWHDHRMGVPFVSYRVRGDNGRVYHGRLSPETGELINLTAYKMN